MIFFLSSFSTPTTTGIAFFLFSYHILPISTLINLYLESFWNPFVAMFWSTGTDISIRRHVLFLLYFTGLLAFTFLTVCIGNSRKIVTSSSSVTGSTILVAVFSIWGSCSVYRWSRVSIVQFHHISIWTHLIWGQRISQLQDRLFQFYHHIVSI